MLVTKWQNEKNNWICLQLLILQLSKGLSNLKENFVHEEKSFSGSAFHLLSSIVLGLLQELAFENTV